MFIAGRLEKVHAGLGNRSTFHRFDTADGAGEHCAVGAFVQQNQVVLDWFQEVLHHADLTGCTGN